MKNRNLKSKRMVSSLPNGTQNKGRHQPYRRPYLSKPLSSQLLHGPFEAFQSETKTTALMNNIQQQARRVTSMAHYVGLKKSRSEFEITDIRLIEDLQYQIGVLLDNYALLLKCHHTSLQSNKK